MDNEKMDLVCVCDFVCGNRGSCVQRLYHGV